jgi:hypothetical protein
MVTADSTQNQRTLKDWRLVPGFQIDHIAAAVVAVGLDSDFDLVGELVDSTDCTPQLQVYRIAHTVLVLVLDIVQEVVRRVTLHTVTQTRCLETDFAHW